MPLSYDQELTLLLAGTVALPSPAPACGTVEVETAEGGDPGKLCDLYLEITHRVSTRLTLVRTVRLADVRLIRAVWPGQKEKTSAEVKTPKGFLPLAETRALAEEEEEATPWLTQAVVYVLEWAPVLLRVEVGMTAAESADYYPPIDGGGRTPGGGLGAGGRVDQRKGQFLKEFLKVRGAAQGHAQESAFAFSPCTSGEPPDDDPTF